MSHLDRRAAVQTTLIALLPRSMSETVKVQELDCVSEESFSFNESLFEQSSPSSQNQLSKIGFYHKASASSEKNINYLLLLR